MNVKEILKNYRQNSLKLSIAKANDRMTSELEEIERDMHAIDMATNYLKPTYQLIIEEHCRQGISFYELGSRKGYTANAMKSRASYATKALEALLN